MMMILKKKKRRRAEKNATNIGKRERDIQFNDTRPPVAMENPSLVLERREYTKTCGSLFFVLFCFVVVVAFL